MKPSTLSALLDARARHHLTWTTPITEGIARGIHNEHRLHLLCRAAGRLSGVLSTDRATLTWADKTFPLECTTRATAHLADLQEGEQEVVVSVWPTRTAPLLHAPTLSDFALRTLLINCITPVKQDTHIPPIPHFLVGGLIRARHKDGFEVALSSKRAKISPVYVRVLGKTETKAGHPFCGVCTLVSLGGLSVLMLEQEFDVNWMPYRAPSRQKSSTKKTPLE